MRFIHAFGRRKDVRRPLFTGRPHDRHRGPREASPPPGAPMFALEVSQAKWWDHLQAEDRALSAQSSPAIASTSSTMRRRRLGSFISMKVLVSARPSTVARNSDTYVGNGAAPIPSGCPGRCGAPSKKKGTGI